MSARHLLSCSCGQTVAVAPSQAGGQVRCECGATLDVPRLGQLRQLPTDGHAEPRAAAAWSFRLGTVTAGIVAAVVFGLLAAWFAATEPDPPPPFDREAQTAYVDTLLEKATPAQLWRRLVDVYEPLAERGMTKHEIPGAQQVEERIAQSQGFQTGFAVAAGVAALIAVVALVALPK